MTTEFQDEFMQTDNCCTSPNLPRDVNRARHLAAAALTLAIVNVFQLGQMIMWGSWGPRSRGAGVVSGLGALPSLVSASMVICCSPKQIDRPGHGAAHFAAAGGASAVGCVLYLVAVVVWAIQIEETKKCAADEDLEDDYEYDAEVSTAELCRKSAQFATVNPMWMVVCWFVQLVFASRCFKAKDAVNKIEVGPWPWRRSTGVAVQGIPVATTAAGVPIGAPQTFATATATVTAIPAQIQGPVATAVRVGSS